MDRLPTSRELVEDVYAMQKKRIAKLEAKLEQSGQDSWETAGRNISLRSERDRLRELLDKAVAGLDWYAAEHPESHSEADEEFKVEAKAALAREADET